MLRLVGGCDSGGRTRRAIAVAAVLLLPPISLALGPADAASATTVKSAHVAFGTCFARSIDLKVAVSTRTLSRHQSLAVVATVTNTGTASCTYSGDNGPTQGVGNCSALTLTVFNAKGRNVWPGGAVFHCPVSFSEHLAPNATVTATGSWQQQVFAPHQGTAPRGHYTVVVEKQLRFPLTLR